MASWVEEEFKSVDLGDKRLNQRLINTISAMADHPGMSIPAACKGWKETKGAYRLFEQDMSWEDIAEPHWECTLQRAKAEKIVLCLQDTTELDFNGRQTEGLGKLNYDSRRGMYLHPTVMVTPERLTLGVTDAWMWARNGQQPKESKRWAEGFERLVKLKTHLPQTQLVYIGDREADLFDIYKQHSETPCVDYLIRSQHNRLLNDGSKLKDKLDVAPVLGEIEFTLPKGRKRKSRQVRQALKSCCVVLKKDNIAVTALLAEEVSPPAGQKPVRWVLLTNRPINTLVEAEELIGWYLCRWEVELFFKVLKSGCQIEGSQLRCYKKLERILMIKMIIAWRIMYLMRLNGVAPEINCEAVFEPDEWRIIYVSTLREKPPEETPTLGFMIRLVASHGGFLGRKGDGEPGVKSMWLGLEKCYDIVSSVLAVREVEQSCG